MNTQTIHRNPPAAAWRLLLAAAALAAAPLSHAQAVREAPAMVDSWTLPANKNAVAEQNSSFRQRAARALPVPATIALEALPAEATVQKSAARAGAPLQIGVGRKVALTEHAQATSDLLQWQSLPDGGQVAAISFTSPQALGVRIGLHVETLPPGTTLRVYAQDGQTELEISANEVLTTIQRNINADGDTAQARTYWLPPVDGSEATVEIETAPGVSTEAVAVSVPMIAHRYDTPEDAMQRASGSCNVNVMCRPEYEGDRSSVASIQFQEQGYWYICSGTLLNNTARDGTPYFLTANHCISSQTVASSMVSDWFYWNESCGGGTVNPGRAQLTGGATLLWSESHSDTTLLRLNASAPQGATFQGWLADEAVPKGAAISGLHHPNGDSQKVSLGTVAGYSYCITGLCAPVVSLADSSHYTVQWSSGVTEGGSSGSALLYQKDGARYLVGVLTSGSSDCSNRSGTDHYGRFNLAFDRGNLGQWLSPSDPVGGKSPVYRFYNASTKAHFFTSSESERDYVMVNYPAFRYENVAFYVQPSQVIGSSPVFRFFHQSQSTHFYTINESERDAIIANWPVYKPEGTAWYASKTAADGASPLYRFYLRSKSVHFYTISQAERDAIIANWPEYEYEGVGYYAWTSQ